MSDNQTANCIACLFLGFMLGIAFASFLDSGAESVREAVMGGCR